MAAVPVLPGAAGTALSAHRTVRILLAFAVAAAALLTGPGADAQKKLPSTPDEIDARVRRSEEEAAALEGQAEEQQAAREKRAREAEARRAEKAEQRRLKEKRASQESPGGTAVQGSAANPSKPGVSRATESPEQIQARRRAEINATAAKRKAGREAHEARYQESAKKRGEERRRREESFATEPPKAPNLERNPF